MDKLTSAEAKKEFFLTTQDLLVLPYESLGFGFGSGRPTKLYEPADLEAAASKKHGIATLQSKRAKRTKREENQRKKEDAAAKAEEDLLNTSNNENAPENNRGAIEPPADLKDLRKDIRNAFKPLVTWDHLRSRNARHGCDAACQVMRVQQQEYAALIGRSNDPQLKTLVKSGAWYSIVVPFETVMGSMTAIIGKGGRYGCNSDLGISPENDMTVKYSPSNKTLSVSGYVQHVETFGFGD